MSVERAPGVKTAIVDLFRRAATALKGAVVRNKIPQPTPIPASPCPGVSFESFWTASHSGLIIEYVDPADVQLAEAAEQLTQAQEQLTEAQRHSLTDPLTGLPNRRAYQDKIAKEIARAERYGHPLSVAMIDIDHFKKVNDGHGHPAGDFILQEVAKILQREIRGSDFVARFGGEEMVVILTETNGDKRGSVKAMERVRKAIKDHVFEYNEKRIKITISVGISSYTKNPKDDYSTVKSTNRPIDEQTVMQADCALYFSKEDGRNRVTHASELPAPRNA